MSKQATRQFRLVRRLLPVSVILLGLGVTLALAVVRLPTRGPLLYDESVHALKGLAVAYDLSHHDWLGLAFNSYRQVLYPPLHSWLLGVAYVTIGPTLITSAGVSLALYLLGGILLYWAGGQLARGRANIAGATAALFWFTSPPLHDYALQVMLEMAGLAVLVLALLVAHKLLADDTRSADGRGLVAPAPRQWFWLGVAVALTYFARIPYGVILGLALAATLLARAGLRPQRLWRPEIGWLLLPLLLILGIWFAYPAKIPATLQWLVGSPDGIDDPYSMAGLFYYPLTLVRLGGSPWLFSLFMAALVWSCLRRKSLGLVLLVLLLLIQFGSGMLHQNKQARFLFPMLPALFLIGGLALDGLWQWARTRHGYARLTAGIAAAMILGQGILLTTNSLHPGPGDRPDPVTADVLAHLDLASSTLILGSWEMGYPTPGLLDWKLIAAGKLAAPQAGSSAQIEEGRRLAQLLPRLPLPGGIRQALGATFTAYDAPATLRTLYAGIPQRASYSQGGDAYVRFVRDLLAAKAINRVIVVNHSNARRYLTAQLVAPLPESGFVVLTETTYEDARMMVTIYDRK